MIRLILIFILSIVLGMLFNFNQELFNVNQENFDVNKLNIVGPPKINKISDNPKSVRSSDNEVCFRKPTLKYDGIWGIDKNDSYCGTSPSFQFNEEIIDGKYFTDDGCVGGDYLKICCDDIKEIHKTIYKK